MRRTHESRFALPACVVLAMSSAACGGGAEPERPAAVMAPSPTPSPPMSNGPNFLADATVMSSSGGAGCGWGRTVGETRAQVGWRITMTGDAILLEEDMDNWPTDHIPFSGKLTGLQFAAAYWNGDDYLQWRCQFREAALSGSFSADRSSFEAVETLAWGPPERETRVQRRWTGQAIR